MRKLKLDELNRLSNVEFQALTKIPVVIVLDNIRSAMNVGSVFRSADAFAIDKIYLCGISAKPPHREINKTAIGATESVKWEYFNTREEVYNRLKTEQCRIVAIEQTNKSIPLKDFKITMQEKLAIIFGNEVDGVHDMWIECVDSATEIRQYGTKHSLNIGVCAGIVLYHLSTLFKNE